MRKKSFLLFVILCCITLLVACVFVACNPDSGEQTGQPGEGDGGKDETMFFTVTFDTQGGSKIADIKVESGHIVGEFALPAKQCARLVGFALDADGERMWDVLTDKVSADITLYAIWEDAHDWGEWVVTTPATCTEDGEKTRTCNACGETEKEVVPAAHTWGEWETVTDPTCTTDGTQKRVCEECGKEETDSIPALGHDFAEEYTVDIAPDCETKGSESRHCTRCNAATDSREIAALGHDYEGAEWHYNDANHWQYCTRCGKESERELHSYDSDGVCECGMMITPVGEFLFTSLGNNTWRLDKYTGSRTNVYIPSMYNNGTVIEINEEAFSGNTSMQTLVIPDTVTSIGARAFSGCVNLTSVTVSKNLTSIGEDAFDGCAQITNATIPTIAIDYIPQNNITTVILTGGTKISAWAFENCTGLKSITISESVTSIGIYAFYGCTGLTEINWNAVSVADLNSSSNAFYNAGTAGEGITVTFGESVQKIPAYLFCVDDSSYCPNIKSVTISDSVTSIGDSAFSGCSKIKTATMPTIAIDYIPKNNITTLILTSGTSIGDRAFYGRTGLKSITIPESVASIGIYAFYGCTGLTEINWNAVSVADLNSSSNAFRNAGTAGAGITVTFGESVRKIPAYLFAVNPLSGFPYITSVTIPDSVTSIGDSAFNHCSGLTSITIPDGVKSIGDYAFEGCSGLTSITISDSVTSIGNHAFSGCSGLTSVTMGNGVTSIGDYAFRGCSGLTSVTIGNSVTSIGDDAFYNCMGLKSVYYTADIAGWCGISGLGSIMSSGRTLYIDGNKVEGKITIPDGVKTVSSYAFAYQTGITYIIIPDSVTDIESYAFYNFTGLKSITIPESVASIGESMFSGCTGLTSIYYTSDMASWFGKTWRNIVMSSGRTLYIDGNKVEGKITIPDGVEIVPSYAFAYQTGITHIIIPDSVTGIESYAFYNFTGLTSVTMGRGVSSIGEYAFSGCTGLTEINWNALSVKNFISSNNVFYNAGTAGEGVMVTFGESVQKIPEYLFYVEDSSYRPNITSVTIGNSVTSIGRGAFSGCNNLTSVIIGNSVTSIREEAFQNCSSLTSVAIPDSVTRIGMSAFSGCSGLESITIPFAGLTSGETSGYPFGCIFGSSAYSGGTGVTQKYYYSLGQLQSTTYYIPSTLREVTVTGKNILRYAFYGCMMLTSVTIGDSMTDIGSSAFENCSGLTSIYYTGDMQSWLGKDWHSKIMSSGRTLYIDGNKVEGAIAIPDGVSNIPSYAFAYQTGITSVTISDSVTSIGYSAFYNCSGLTSITIPDSVTNIGDYAFSGCSGLTSITIPDSVTSIGDYAFSGCSGLTSVYYTGDVAGWCGISFGNTYANPLYYAGNLYIDGSLVKDLVIPDSVTSIGNYAFSDCSGLTSVTIGKGVTSIGRYAFSDCSGLTSIHYTGDMQSWLSKNWHGEIMSSGRTLYIDGNKVEGIIVIPDGITRIPSYAFAYRTGITSITIPDSVTSIGASAFRDCSGLTSVTIGNGVESIGSYAFYYCSGLTSITIPDGVTSIEAYAFFGCDKLVEVYNKSKLNIVAGSSGYGCVAYYAKNVYKQESGSKLTTDENGFVFYYDGATGYLVGYTGNENELVLPDGFTAYDGTIVNSYDIYKYAFSGCSGLTSVTIGNSVTSIEQSAFAGCSGLTEITWNAVSVNDIGSDVFFNAGTAGDGITVIFGDSVQRIPAYLFYVSSSSYRPNIKSVTIGKSVTSIGSGAFRGCSGLTSVTIGNGVTSIGDLAFYGCSGLTSVTFENTSGWQVSTSSDFSRYDTPSSSSLSNPSTAANYLKSTYKNYYWRRV